jgi:anaerobic magnesium-protoporphyrin IX monomethyl ester cyclase
MVHEFKELLKYLRKNGVSAHFTIGGHFPTIEYEKTLQLMPELDTVVTHEGEITILELFKNLKRPDKWRGITGIAFKINGEITCTPPRQLIENLDSLPFPIRGGKKQNYRGINCASILASRGCYYNCSFCSIRQFYLKAPGPKRRSRSAFNVAQEMEKLYKKNVRIFKFVDDDLGMKTKAQKTWINEFASELKRRKIGNKILWRISNRLDELDLDCLKILKQVGLTFVYLGIESGNNPGLKTCNKHYMVKDVFNALDLLERADMKFDYGFMMFTPNTTFDSIEEDLKFLRKLTLNGRALVHFTKMFPYAGTSIEEQLKRDGRLEGTLDYPTYQFNDRRINLMEVFVTKTFHEAFFGSSAIVNKLRLLYLDVEIIRKFYPNRFNLDEYANSLRNTIIDYNESALETLEIALNFMRKHDYEDILYFWTTLEFLTRQEISSQSSIDKRITTLVPKIL